jgi:hypothetical protein
VLFAELSNPAAKKVMGTVPAGAAVAVGAEVLEGEEVAVGVDVAEEEGVAVGVGVEVAEVFEAVLCVFDNSMYATSDTTRIRMITIVM